MVDAIRQMLESIETLGNEGDRKDGELIQTLTKLQQGAPQKESEDAQRTASEASRRSGAEA